MDVAQHWHAYEWTGHERPHDSVRIDPSNGTPPLEISHWLRKPARHVVHTFDNSEDGVSRASGWMRKGGEENPALDEAAFGLDARMTYVDDELRRGADSLWGYYSGRGRYVSRALIACPRGGTPCPYGR
ncbi:hypothetical protein [Streptomyces uncialis]|uniref:hypothetical protein n=1 Tax=Streptomyces uncialis TaxID=1048205 RepID=UPI003797D249